MSEVYILSSQGLMKVCEIQRYEEIRGYESFIVSCFE